MTENEKVMLNENAEGDNKSEVTTDDSLKPILPDEEYASEVAKEDPEKLEEARRKVLSILRVKAKCLGGDAFVKQIQPMIYSMSISDCNQMYEVLSKHGIMGLTRMAMKHNKEEKKKKN